MERWKSDAINDLRMLDARRMAIKSLKARCDEIETDMAGISAATCDRTPIRGGGNRQEAMLAGTIDQLNKVIKKREAMICLVEQTERVLAALSDRDRMILETMYVHRKPNPVRFLGNRLYLSPSGVYSAKDAALLRFAAMMGYR